MQAFVHQEVRRHSQHGYVPCVGRPQVTDQQGCRQSRQHKQYGRKRRKQQRAPLLVPVVIERLVGEELVVGRDVALVGRLDPGLGAVQQIAVRGPLRPVPEQKHRNHDEQPFLPGRVLQLRCAIPDHADGECQREAQVQLAAVPARGVFHVLLPVGQGSCNDFLFAIHDGSFHFAQQSGTDAPDWPFGSDLSTLPYLSLHN